MVSEHLKFPENFGVLNLRQEIIEQIEPILLRTVMERCKYNQRRAAYVLGISRNTCRKLLIKYFDKKYCTNCKMI
ncbi:helix-turn-helix domain-containing protein [Fluoribacter gormanii]|uniref:helix-turn-helix domain-containing protein n=1 Tax=Fluoribacter gormanii TaxID=464 RepID=UPI003BF81930